MNSDQKKHFSSITIIVHWSLLIDHWSLYMSLILNLETATSVCSVALGKDGKLIAIKEINQGYSHAENLTIFIQEILDSIQIELTDLDALAISKGPGSFTGLRIGTSTAKGLCYALNKPLIAIPTLRAMTFSENISRLITHNSYLFCPMLDARRMEVYCSIYNFQNKEIRKTSAEIIDEHSFADLLKENKIVFFGDGAPKCKPALSHHPNAIFVDDVFPSAKNLITLSEHAFLSGDFENIAYFEPYYLKDFIAGSKKLSSNP